MYTMFANLVFAVLATACFVTASVDIVDELAGQWKMGMRPRQASTNLQAFGGQLGGQVAPAITNSGDPERPFEVDGDTFPDYNSAFDRACDNQKNKCADQANNGGGDFEVGDCDNQNNECKAAGASATQTSFSVLVTSDAEFDYFCDP